MLSELFIEFTHGLCVFQMVTMSADIQSLILNRQENTAIHHLFVSNDTAFIPVESRLNLHFRAVFPSA